MRRLLPFLSAAAGLVVLATGACFLASCGGSGGGQGQVPPISTPEPTAVPPSPLNAANIELQDGRAVRLSYPNFGKETVAVPHFDENGSTTVWVISELSEDDSAIQFGITFWPNPNRLPLTEWFAREADPSGAILSAGGYELFALQNGMDVFRITGELPSSYKGGPISTLYASAPSGDPILVIAIGSEHAFDRSYEDVERALIEMFATMSIIE